MRVSLSMLFIVLFGLQTTAQNLPDKIAAVKLVMAAYGFTYVDARYCTLQEGGQCYFDRSFYGGSDYIIMAVGDVGVADLDLYANDILGARYTQDTSMGEFPAVSFHKYTTGVLSIYAKNVDSYSRTREYSVAILVGYK